MLAALPSCRACTRLASRFNKEGEPGRKITCQECHQQKVGDQPPAGESGEPALADKTINKKKRKLAPKVC